MKIKVTENQLKKIIEKNKQTINEGWFDEIISIGKNIFGPLLGIGKNSDDVSYLKDKIDDLFPSDEDKEKLKKTLEKKEKESEITKTPKKKEEPTKEKKKEEPSGKEKTITKGSYVIQIGNPERENIAVVWGGWPSAEWGGKQMKSKYGQYLKGKNVIYSNFENDSIFEIEKILEKEGYDDYEISSVCGFSRGGINAWNTIGQLPTDVFIGLIDPSTSQSHLSIKNPTNVVMMYNDNNWGSYPTIKQRLPIAAKNLGKNAKKVNLPHSEIPKKFFEDYYGKL
jgi:hypothetical protein